MPDNKIAEAIEYLSDGFVNLLRNAGHNVIRFNSSDAATTALTAAERTALNTNDLVIVGRDIGSGAFTGIQGTNWNRDITKPLILMSSYLGRNNRLLWFTGANVPDGTPTKLTAVNPSDLETDYIFGGVAMETNTTVALYDEPFDRNTHPLGQIQRRDDPPALRLGQVAEPAGRVAEQCHPGHPFGHLLRVVAQKSDNDVGGVHPVRSRHRDEGSPLVEVVLDELAGGKPRYRLGRRGEHPHDLVRVGGSKAVGAQQFLSIGRQ